MKIIITRNTETNQTLPLLNLINNVEYALAVYNLIVNNVE